MIFLKFNVRPVVIYLIIFKFTASVNVRRHQQSPEEKVEDSDKKAPIIKQFFEQDNQGYKFSYETGNGIHASQSGYFKDNGDKEPILVQQGEITYYDEHGNAITLTYIADENGFRPQGNHLPTPPPVPVEIQKLQQIDHNLHQQDPRSQFPAAEAESYYSSEEQESGKNADYEEN